MKCDACGYIRQKNDDHFIAANECPSCGMSFDNNTGHPSNAFTMEADFSEPGLRPSPVDADSLKKARERVEKRLKERLASQKRDVRHDQTLELARRFASEGVRKRQEQWKQQQAPDQESDDSPSDPPAEDLAAGDSSNDAGADAVETDAVEADAVETDAVETDAVEADAVETDAVETDAALPEILDMEADSESTIQKSWFVPSGETAATVQSDTPPEAEPDVYDQPPTDEVPTESGVNHQRKRWRWDYSRGLTRLLPLVAWLILVAGISGAILSWTTLTEAQAGVQTHPTAAGNSMNLGLLLGFAYLVTGVLGFAFFWVSSLMSRQLKDIRQLLLLQPIPRSRSTEAEPMPAPEQTH